MKKSIIAFSGPSNSGKTTLITKIANEFIKQNLKVLIIKHDPADKAQFDVNGKDSFKFFQSGAEVMVLSPTRTTFFSHEKRDILSALKIAPDFDLCLVEGLKTLDLPRISVFYKEIDESYFAFSNAIASYEKIDSYPNLTWAIISEEKDEILNINENAKFIVAYDPLDGSSLMDVNFAIGSIFAIYEEKASAKNLKAALYSMYGARLELVICEDKPKLYRLDKNNKFVFVKDLQMQEKGKINATGGTQKFWEEKHAKFIKKLFDEGYRLRYSGAMVSDINQILLKGGGLFSYPATSDAPKGKLRAFFEVFPLAFIIEKAGGKTTNGKNHSLLELDFDEIHATTPCFFGSKYEISELLKAYNE